MNTRTAIAAMFLPLLALSCASAPRDQGPSLEDQYQEQVQKLDAAMNAALIPEDAPLTLADFEGAALEQTKKDVCEVKKGCDAKLQETLHARWKSRYNFCNFDSFLEYCKGHPKECRDRQQSERGLRQSHNEGIKRQRDAYAQDLYGRYQAARQQQLQGLMQAAQLQNMQFQQMQMGLQNMQHAVDGGSRVDQACVSRCQAAGSMLQFCQSKCGY